jgi:hypothetical protein
VINSTAGQSMLRGWKTLIYPVLDSGFLRLGRSNGAVSKAWVG